MNENNTNRRQETQKLEEVALERERYQLLRRLEDSLETPMLILAFVWLALLVGELILGENLAFEVIGTVIWIIFILDFVIKLVLAPRKTAYFKKNWLTAISLLVPALRIFRLFRVVSSLNRGMRALRANLERRGFGYVIILTMVVVLAGAAGMYAFENTIPNGLTTYSEAVWWTAMIMTTLGSEYWPQTLEGRVLGFILALYAFAIFGYVTATLATFFVGRDAENEETEIAGAEELVALRKEISALRSEIRTLSGSISEE